ncbi:MAG TPA: cupin domain-containing protein [Halalkalibaculum sp.]|nr:cupin domain-containing protein [Halalkalibaculum sp.]
MADNSKVIKSSDYRWSSVSRKEYKDSPGCYEGVSRYSLLGEGGDEQELNFQTRYFEVKPGGYTSFERHRHPHSVVIIRGSGSVVLGDEVHELGMHDVVFISPNTMHQFHADKQEPLGFICIVDRYRDKPELPDDETVQHEISDKKVLDKIKR